MPFPGTTISVSNGNLLRYLSVTDGYGAVIGTVATAGLIGKVQKVYSLPDAVQKGYTQAAEPFMYKLLKELYEELGGNMKVYVYGTAETETMADAVSSTNVTGINKLLSSAAGDISLVAIARKPSAGYAAGAGFLDSDVAATVTAIKTTAQAWQAKNMPFRALIEGRVANASVNSAYSPNTANNGYCAVVLGSQLSDKSASVTVALARALKYGAQVKIGNGQNGALSVGQIYIGATAIEERLDLEDLHNQGFIVFRRKQGLAGYFFGVDNMCSDDDYKILAHGRVIDKAQRVLAKALSVYDENDIEVDADGSPEDGWCSHLEKEAEQQIKANMAGQISDVQVIIDPAQGAVGNETTEIGIINSSKLYIAAKVLPKGYTTWLDVTLGLTSTL